MSPPPSYSTRYCTAQNTGQYLLFAQFNFRSYNQGSLECSNVAWPYGTVTPIFRTSTVPRGTDECPGLIKRLTLQHDLCEPTTLSEHETFPPNSSKLLCCSSGTCCRERLGPAWAGWFACLYDGAKSTHVLYHSPKYLRTEADTWYWIVLASKMTDIRKPPPHISPAVCLVLPTS